MAELEAALDRLAELEATFLRELEKAQALVEHIKAIAPKKRPKDSLVTAKNYATTCRRALRDSKGIREIAAVSKSAPVDLLTRYVDDMTNLLQVLQAIMDLARERGCLAGCDRSLEPR